MPRRTVLSSSERASLYCRRHQTLNFDCAKAPGLDDHKWACIINTNPFTIVQPRELSHKSKSKLDAVCSIFALADNQDDLIQQYTFSESDLSIIRQHRGAANRLGFAVQLCYMRYPGIILSINEKPFPPLLNLVADQLKVSVDVWEEYGKRDQTRREHLAELQTIFGFQTFSMEYYQASVNSLADLAWQTDKGIVLASILVQSFRDQRILLPSINVIERICAEAITNAARRVYCSLTECLTKEHLQRLNALRISDYLSLTAKRNIRQLIP